MKYIFLFFILFCISISSEISQHYLGASFDISNKSAVFIDKFNCKANPHFEFKLSSNLKVTSLSLYGIEQEYIVTKSSKVENSYKIKRNFWEPKEALITIQYQTDSSSLFREITPNKLIQLNSDEIYYPTGDENSTIIEFHLQIPNNWKIVSDGNVTRLKNKQNSFKISSDNRITKLNLLFLNNFNETPQLDKILLNLYSADLNKVEKEEFINLNQDTKNYLENLLGPFPHPKLDIIFSDLPFNSNSVAFYNQINDLDRKSKIEEIIFNQYFKFNVYPKNDNELFWIYSVQAYLLDYLPLLNKNTISANLFRKNILNSHSKSLIPTNLKKYSEDFYNQYKIQTYLFLLFTLEDYIGKHELIKRIQKFLNLNKNKFVSGLDFFQFLYSEINPNLEFYFSERFNEEINYPFFEIVESIDAISILQPEKVLPMFIPLKFHYNNGEIKDSLIFTKSFKTNVLNKQNKHITKVEVDPTQSCLRTLHSTELEAKIKDIFENDKIQVSISSKLKNSEKIKGELIKQLDFIDLTFTDFNNINSEEPAIIIGDLPSEYKYLSTKSDIILNGRKFYLKNHCLAYTFNNQKNDTNLLIYSKSKEQIIPVIKKLKFFKNYSYFILRNGNNAGKGVHKTHSKQLVWEKK